VRIDEHKDRQGADAADSQKEGLMASKSQSTTPARKIKTRIKVVQDTGRGSKPRQRTYEVQDKDTGAKLGLVVEIWTDGVMAGDAYKNSVQEQRRALSATDAKGKTLGSEFTSRARAVAAVRNAAQA
jgi:hypothetical protein